MAIPDGDFACGDAKCSKRAAFNPFAPYPTFANAALGKLRGARPSAKADGRMGAAAFCCEFGYCGDTKSRRACEAALDSFKAAPS